jgi:hypothetical protein
VPAKITVGTSHVRTQNQQGDGECSAAHQADDLPWLVWLLSENTLPKRQLRPRVSFAHVRPAIVAEEREQPLSENSEQFAHV